LVPDLGRDQFQIEDNGKRQDISLFTNDTQPITVVMLLDRSGSMRANFSLVEKAAEQFVNVMLPGDKARIGSFSDRIQVDPRDFTSDHGELIDILHNDLQPAGATPLWNAINVGITDLLHQEGRRVVLVFTDGKDAPPNMSGTNTSLKDVMKRAEQENVMVYAIGLASSGGPRRGYGGGYGGRRPGGGYGGRGGGVAGRRARRTRRVRRRPRLRQRAIPGRQAGRRAAENCGSDGRRLLRADVDRRPREDLHARRRRAPSSVRAGFHAREARRQDAQARAADHAEHADGACAAELPRDRTAVVAPPNEAHDDPRGRDDRDEQHHCGRRRDDRMVQRDPRDADRDDILRDAERPVAERLGRRVRRRTSRRFRPVRRRRNRTAENRRERDRGGRRVADRVDCDQRAAKRPDDRMDRVPHRVEPRDLVGDELDEIHRQRGADDDRVIERAELVRQRDELEVRGGPEYRD